MALSRSPANMETEEGEKLQLTLWFEDFKRGDEGNSVFIFTATSVQNGRIIDVNNEQLGQESSGSWTYKSKGRVVERLQL